MSWCVMGDVSIGMLCLALCGCNSLSSPLALLSSIFEFFELFELFVSFVEFVSNERNFPTASDSGLLLECAVVVKPVGLSAADQIGIQIDRPIRRFFICNRPIHRRVITESKSIRQADALRYCYTRVYGCAVLCCVVVNNQLT